ncbi:hypothetical protein [Croceiramulus getboli]|nr:hypothetical protein P8624_01120 [Flavobacteriaceae bacterium YJPT1-3]
MKNKFGELLFQIVPVAIGVFLGYLVSDWSASKDQQKQEDLLVQNMIAEIKSNQSKIDEVLEYHVMLRDSTRYYLQNAWDGSSNGPRFWRGVNTPTLANSAFETGIQTGVINGLELEKIQSLNQTYSYQDNYHDFVQILLSGLITMDFSEDQEAITKILRYINISMTDIVYKEEELLRSYRESLAQLDPAYIGETEKN